MLLYAAADAVLWGCRMSETCCLCPFLDMLLLLVRVVTNQSPSWSDCNLCWCAIDQSNVPMTKQAIDHNAMRLIGRLFRLPSNGIGRSVL
jgi:hypothetical protein